VSNGIDWASVGSIATAVAVFLAAWQLRRGTVQARTDFEDDLSREYRELARSIPPIAHLDQDLGQPEFAEAFPVLFQYIDLSNEQAFLRMNGRISKVTWINWRDGIQSNLQRRAFRQAWEQIKAGSDNFSELRRLEQSGFAEDPWCWQPWHSRLWRWLSA
jgi:hypothetical protein